MNFVESVYRRLSGSAVTTLRHKLSAMSQKNGGRSLIDVIIPVYNQPELTKACVKSVKASTFMEYNLVIADDNSPDPNMRWATAGCKVIFNKSGTQGFPHNCNYAASKTKGEFILLLNNDTIARPLWIDAMCAEMDDPSVGIVGAKLIYPASHKYGNCIQHAGVARNKHSMPYHIWRGSSPSYPPANQRRELNAVTFACALIRRKLWEELGGLCEDYVGGQWEDMDFCNRARQAGWRIVYQPNAVLYHYEHGSGEDFVELSTKTNRQLYFERWRHLGSDEYLFNTQSLPDKLEEVAPIVHQLRARSLTYLLQNLSREHIDRCTNVSRLPYKNLPPQEQDISRNMAETLLTRLGEIK